MRFLRQYRKLHEKRCFPGYSLLQWVPEIAELVVEFKSTAILDYGCGLGFQYTRERAHNVWGGEIPTLYDPAVGQFSSPHIGKFEGVICTDVIEHVPEDELTQVLREISGFARQWAFISICCRPSKHIVFEDGQNVHVTLKPFDEWQRLIPPYFDNKVRVVIRETK